MCLKAYEAYSVHPDFGSHIILAGSHISAGKCFKSVAETNRLPRPISIKRRPDLDKLALKYSGQGTAVYIGGAP